MEDYPNYISQAELIHLPATGMHYIWHNGRTGDATILKKLDWAWGNQQLLTQWSLAKATFQTRLSFDHSPIILSLSPSPPLRKPRFNFLNLWTEKEGYEEAVTSAWNGVAYGNPISKLTTKLRSLKEFLHQLHQSHTYHISARVS
ncbi:hypothetical protein OIU85_022483 [Salix viminalis]|uniref:Endonuclease/exonuclease/phosphatase domain-containing protein n=1 Tax=Salix viminalis TaxID=40686 RepID=A0A9Q0U6Y0_SALVM|nr:hypothetical protein OIU85_022483 [Salix viminalis]